MEKEHEKAIELALELTQDIVKVFKLEEHDESGIHYTEYLVDRLNELNLDSKMFTGVYATVSLSYNQILGKIQ